MDKEQLIKQITVSDFNSYQWLDKDTFHCYLKLPIELSQLIDNPAWNSDIEVEYWKDEDSFHYLKPDDENWEDGMTVIKEFNCDYLNQLVSEYINSKESV
jgi:hypothetical protein